MKIKTALTDFVTTFAVTLIVAAVVSYFYSLIVHESRMIDWETSFRMALILGIIMPWFNARSRKDVQKNTLNNSQTKNKLL